MDKMFDIIAEDAEKILANFDLSELKGKTILITGASGVIGNYFLASLWEFLNKEPSETKVFAVMQSEPLPYLKSFLNYSGAEIIFGDLSDYDFCRSLPNADYIIHAAGYGQPGRFMEDQVKTLKINTMAMYALFEKLNTGGKFLFISSSEVYSGLFNPPFSEKQIGNTNTTHPRSCYIEAKRCGEAICNAYISNGIKAKSARLSLAYGPGTKPDDKRVLNSFIQKALQQKEIKLLDLGEAKRTYCYAADAVEIMWNILLHGQEAVYNVGGNSKITVGDLAKKIGDYLNIPVIFPKNSNNAVSGAPDDVFLNMNKVENEFNKKDYIDFNAGLERTIEWQKELYK
jgi:UDP-glucuronate decarboxylase